MNEVGIAKWVGGCGMGGYRAGRVGMERVTYPLPMTGRTFHSLIHPLHTKVIPIVEADAVQNPYNFTRLSSKVYSFAVM